MVVSKKPPRESLQRFAPGIQDFFETFDPSVRCSQDEIDEFYDSWAERKSPEYSVRLCFLVQAIIDASVAEGFYETPKGQIGYYKAHERRYYQNKE